jgi:hypothetical protein
MGCYRVCRVRGIDYYVHRIVWLLCHGVWPRYKIDHGDHDGLNNRISNLTDVTNQVNSMNRALQSNNSSGYHGVRLTRTNRWLARVNIDGEGIHLGTFVEKLTAVRTAKAARKKLGFHPNHGSKVA